MIALLLCSTAAFAAGCAFTAAVKVNYLLPGKVRVIDKARCVTKGDMCCNHAGSCDAETGFSSQTEEDAVLTELVEALCENVDNWSINSHTSEFIQHSTGGCLTKRNGSFTFAVGDRRIYCAQGTPGYEAFARLRERVRAAYRRTEQLERIAALTKVLNETQKELSL